jgi:branched-chain amino acid transport system ATP-binding protein
MTVFENVLVGAMQGANQRHTAAYARAVDVLQTCGLVDVANRRAADLGLLDRKRLELGRALATDPKVLFLDEIGGGLTDAEAIELVGTIKELRARGIAIIWIEHIVHVLVQAIDRLVCLDAGRIIADGLPDAVLNDRAVIDAYLGASVT